MRDIVVLGGGPAGVTAAIYAKRSGKDPLLITMDIGGQTTLTSEIENVPGFSSIMGVDFATKLKNQLTKWNVEIKYEEIKKVEKVANHFKVFTSKGEYEAKSVIIALGRKHRKLNVPGEDKFAGKGVSYCAICDGFFFAGKTVAVIGGGNTALVDAIYMTQFAKKVILIHRRDQFRAEKVLVDRLKSKQNVEFILNAEVKEIIGDQQVSGLILKDGRKIDVDGVFIAIGEVPNSEPFKNLVEINEHGEIIVDEYMHTSVEGVFAAGDITNYRYKQIVIAEAQGAVAALEAIRYLESGQN